MDNYKKEVFKLQADICKTMADANRLMILHELRHGPKSVGEVMAALDLPQSNVSRHLAVLRERGIVQTRREGTTVFYSLASEKIGEACDLVREVLSGQLANNKELAASLDKMSAGNQ